MLTIIQLSFRNVLRNSRRSMLTAATVMLGCALLTIGLSLKWHKDHERGRSLIILGCLSASRAEKGAASRPPPSFPRARERHVQKGETDARTLVFCHVPSARAAFLPGSYASWNLYGAYKGWVGYDYSQVPSYDD